MRASTCAYQGVWNVSFSENVAYVLNEWPIWKTIRGVFSQITFTCSNSTIETLEKVVEYVQS